MANFDTGENAYNDLAAQTAQQRSLAEQQLAQRMSDLGLAAPPATLQNQAQMSGRADLGGVAAQQQGYADYQQALGRAAGLQAEAQGLDIGVQLRGQEATNEQAMDDAKFEVYYNLYTKRKMTAKQFEERTGIPVKAYASYSRKKKSINPWGDHWAPTTGTGGLHGVPGLGVSNNNKDSGGIWYDYSPR